MPSFFEYTNVFERLHHAIEENQLKTVKEILNLTEAAVQILLEKPNQHGLTPLHLAARFNKDPQITQLLIQHGAPLEKTSNAGETPLFTAAGTTWHQSTQVLLALLEAGASITATNNEGLTPLHTAAESGKQAAVSHLIEHGADVNAISTLDENTPLHFAMKKCSETADLLIKNGADENAINAEGFTPWGYAEAYANMFGGRRRTIEIHFY